MRKGAIKTDQYYDLIKNKGLTFIWVAKQLGVSQPYFSMMVTGKRYFSREQIDKLDKLLNRQ